ncbi:hypothetical protein [Methyloceanibacter stevinii]|uniref:hypothetical protein n=1 Tax=Methyloceanibacter stevinii TaxID=1774970 RepID=UPI00114CE9EE|nr:hypothetical protein [Methyloceanibacter stevinii]
MTKNQENQTAKRQGCDRQVYRAGAIPRELMELLEHAKAGDAAAAYDDELDVGQNEKRGTARPVGQGHRL